MRNKREKVSVSVLAKRLGVSTTTIYNRINKGIYKTEVFDRGKMNGFLVYVPDEEDN